MGGALARDDQPVRGVIVDDDTSIGAILKELISKESIQVDVFADGQRAIASLARRPADIVITDLMMADAGGLEVLREAKRVNADAVVIIITGHATLETAIEAVREGAYDYIKKPFKLGEMELAFEKALEKVRFIRKNKALLQELNHVYEQLAAKEASCTAGRERPRREEPPARLHYFSSSLPNLELLKKASENQTRLFEKLEKVAQLREGGLLTGEEYGALKAHIIKSLKLLES